MHYAVQSNYHVKSFKIYIEVILIWNYLLLSFTCHADNCVVIFAKTKVWLPATRIWNFGHQHTDKSIVICHTDNGWFSVHYYKQKCDYLPQRQKFTTKSVFHAWTYYTIPKVQWFCCWWLMPRWWRRWQLDNDQLPAWISVSMDQSAHPSTYRLMWLVIIWCYNWLEVKRDIMEGEPNYSNSPSFPCTAWIGDQVFDVVEPPEQPPFIH